MRLPGINILVPLPPPAPRTLTPNLLDSPLLARSQVPDDRPFQSIPGGVKGRPGENAVRRAATERAVVPPSSSPPPTQPLPKLRPGRRGPGALHSGVLARGAHRPPFARRLPQRGPRPAGAQHASLEGRAAPASRSVPRPTRPARPSLQPSPRARPNCSAARCSPRAPEGRSTWAAASSLPSKVKSSKSGLRQRL